MTKFSITDQIDNDVRLPLLAPLGREFKHPNDGEWVVSIHVKDRDVEHLPHVGTIERRSRVFWVRRETNLVIHDDVDRASGGIIIQLSHVQGFVDHALA